MFGNNIFFLNIILLLERSVNKYYDMLLKTKVIIRVLAITLTFLFSVPSITSQDYTLIGDYGACWDMCIFSCHTGLSLKLKSDSTYSFLYRDDVSFIHSEGTWNTNKDSLFFKPFKIPDSVVISLYFDRPVETMDEDVQDFPYDSSLNVFWILESEENRLKDVDVAIYQNGNKRMFVTDSFGHFKYDGNPADSINFVVRGKRFLLKPNQNNKPSWVKAYIDTSHKDIIYQLFNGSLELINGSPSFHYNCDKEKNKLVVFKKSESKLLIPAQTIFPEQNKDK